MAFSFKKIARNTLFILVFFSFAVWIALRYLDRSKPDGKAGAAAEDLTLQMTTAINKTAWDQTDWVKWTYAGRNTFLWDKKNGMVRVRWNEFSVLLNTTDQSGQAWKNGIRLNEQESQEALQEAWKRFCNDTFWLNAPAKAYDSGVERSIVKNEKGEIGLKVQYTQGGVTPGDAYVWYLDGATGLPTRYEMWVKILPVGGLSATWENWTTLSTGAKIATKHTIADRLPVEVTELSGGTGAVDFTE